MREGHFSQALGTSGGATSDQTSEKAPGASFPCRKPIPNTVGISLIPVENANRIGMNIPKWVAFKLRFKVILTILGMDFQHGKLVPGAFSLVWSLVAPPLVPKTCEKCPSVTRFAQRKTFIPNPKFFFIFKLELKA